MQNDRQVKKKLVENFEFDPNDVKNIQGYQIINAKNILLNQTFTLKRLNLNDPQNQYRHQAMLKEISILKELSGINIIKCHKILKSKSHLYLVYDYYSGRNLTSLIEHNQSIIQNKKIDKLTALKLQQHFIDYAMFQMIGKQLCQVLRQIQTHKIVHMRFWPQSIILGRNNFIKLANFSHAQTLNNTNEGTINQEFYQPNEYLDPFLKQTGNYGFYTDIYSFGIILKKLYQIYQESQSFRSNKVSQQFIQKMTQKNPYQRPELSEIYDHFFGNKRNYESRNRKSRDDVIQRSSSRMIEAQKKTSSISGSKSQNRVKGKQIQQKQDIRISHNNNKNRPQRNQMKTLETRQVLNNSKQSSQIMHSHSQQNKRNRSSNSPTPTQDSPNYFSPLHQSEIIESFKFITINILKRRNLSILLLKLGQIIATKVQGQSFLALQLTFLLYKRSLIEIVGLAKFLSKGSKKYMPDVSQTNRLRFSKTEEYYLLSKVVNQQLQQQRNILVSISSLIKKQCPSVLSFGSQGPSLLSVQAQQKTRQTYIPQLPDFEKQIKYQAFNNEFFIKLIRRYLEMFLSDLALLNKNNQNAKQSFFYLNILFEIYRCQSFENFVIEFFSIEWNDREVSNQTIGKIPTFTSLLGMSPRFVHLRKMTIDQLVQELQKHARD